MRKAPFVRGMRCSLRLCIRILRGSESWRNGNRRALSFAPFLERNGGSQKQIEAITGTQEVLELLLNGIGVVEDDDIFVRMMSWGGVLLLLGLFCVRWLDVFESCTMTVLYE